MIEFRAGFSLRVLIRLFIVLGLVAIAVLFSLDFIEGLYFRDQLTPTGFAVNGGIVALFLLGMGRIVSGLVRYVREERALAHFVKLFEEDAYLPAAQFDTGTLIYRRYQTVLALSRQNAPINHGALASALVAGESTRLSLPRFIHNILILTGVFGTIVSLSIALLGASNLLQSAAEMNSMGMVIHGMSTALSTTVTAIVCYLVYGYFYLKLTDAQTHLVAGIEQVTTLYLLPRYASDSDTMLHEVAGLVKGLQQLAESMKTTHFDYARAGSQLKEVVAVLNQGVAPMSTDIQAIKSLLREGFRLPDASG